MKFQKLVHQIARHDISGTKLWKNDAFIITIDYNYVAFRSIEEVIKLFWHFQEFLEI